VVAAAAEVAAGAAAAEVAAGAVASVVAAVAGLLAAEVAGAAAVVAAVAGSVASGSVAARAAWAARLAGVAAHPGEGAACAKSDEKRRCDGRRITSGLPQQSDKLGVGRHFAKVPETEMMDIWFVAKSLGHNSRCTYRSGIPALRSPLLNRR
jgi:hypothetical protein